MPPRPFSTNSLDPSDRPSSPFHAEMSGLGYKPQSEWTAGDYITAGVLNLAGLHSEKQREFIQSQKIFDVLAPTAVGRAATRGWTMADAQSILSPAGYEQFKKRHGVDRGPAESPESPGDALTPGSTPGPWASAYTPNQPSFTDLFPTRQQAGPLAPQSLTGSALTDALTPSAPRQAESSMDPVISATARRFNPDEPLTVAERDYLRHQLPHAPVDPLLSEARAAMLGGQQETEKHKRALMDAQAELQHAKANFESQYKHINVLNSLTQTMLTGKAVDATILKNAYAAAKDADLSDETLQTIIKSMLQPQYPSFNWKNENWLRELFMGKGAEFGLPAETVEPLKDAVRSLFPSYAPSELPPSPKALPSPSTQPLGKAKAQTQKWTATPPKDVPAGIAERLKKDPRTPLVHDITGETWKFENGMYYHLPGSK